MLKNAKSTRIIKQQAAMSDRLLFYNSFMVQRKNIIFSPTT